MMSMENQNMMIMREGGGGSYPGGVKVSGRSESEPQAIEGCRVTHSTSESELSRGACTIATDRSRSSQKQDGFQLQFVRCDVSLAVEFPKFGEHR